MNKINSFIQLNSFSDTDSISGLKKKLHRKQIVISHNIYAGIAESVLKNPDILKDASQKEIVLNYIENIYEELEEIEQNLKRISQSIRSYNMTAWMIQEFMNKVCRQDSISKEDKIMIEQISTIHIQKPIDLYTIHQEIVTLNECVLKSKVISKHNYHFNKPMLNNSYTSLIKREISQFNILRENADESIKELNSIVNDIQLRLCIINNKIDNI